jgi:hypothetical protein
MPFVTDCQRHLLACGASAIGHAEVPDVGAAAGEDAEFVGAAAGLAGEALSGAVCTGTIKRAHVHGDSLTEEGATWPQLVILREAIPVKHSELLQAAPARG